MARLAQAGAGFMAKLRPSCLLCCGQCSPKHQNGALSIPYWDWFGARLGASPRRLWPGVAMGDAFATEHSPEDCFPGAVHPREYFFTNEAAKKIRASATFLFGVLLSWLVQM